MVIYSDFTKIEKKFLFSHLLKSIPGCSHIVMQHTKKTWCRQTADQVLALGRIDLKYLYIFILWSQCQCRAQDHHYVDIYAMDSAAGVITTSTRENQHQSTCPPTLSLGMMRSSEPCFKNTFPADTGQRRSGLSGSYFIICSFNMQVSLWTSVPKSSINKVSSQQGKLSQWLLLLELSLTTVKQG